MTTIHTRMISFSPISSLLFQRHQRKFSMLPSTVKSFSILTLKDSKRVAFSTYKGPLLSLNLDEKPVRIPLAKLKNRYTNFEAGVRRKQKGAPLIVYGLGAVLIGACCFFIYFDLRGYYHPELENLLGTKRRAPPDSAESIGAQHPAIASNGGSALSYVDAQTRAQQRQAGAR